jgi:isoquinoline 1-oxidoreductase beta subunit
MKTDLARRRFLFVSAAASGALLVGWRFGQAQQTLPYLGAREEAQALGPFIRIEKNGDVIIGARATEIGQGVKTSLPMLIAEELDVDWNHVRVEQLPYGYVDTEKGPSDKYGGQGAGGSDNIPSGWIELRQVGATARALLLQAAAAKWDLPTDQLHTAEGSVIAPDGRKLGYGELVEAAAALDPPKEPQTLKRPDQFTIVGKPTKTVDAPEIVTGRAQFGIDAYLADALVAVILRCPSLDGVVDKVDDAEARAMPGVKDIFVIPGPKPDEPITGPLATGVVVLAENTWAAIKAREKLKVEWKPGPWANESTSALVAKANELLDKNIEPIPVRSDGDFAKAYKSAATRLEARYEMPFLAHATMEPPGALIQIDKDKALLIASLQSPGGASQVISAITGIPRKDIEIRLTRSGGGFGRRLQNDFVAEATLIAKHTGKPVKLIWTREDDLQHDFYRPFGIHALSAGLDKKKKVVAWSHRCAATPRNGRNPKEKPSANFCIEADDFPAAFVANLEKSFFPVASGMPRGAWRAPIHTFHAFAVQSFVDELAIASKQDAVQLRLDLLGAPRKVPFSGYGGPTFDTGRLANVLTLAADKIAWKDKRTNGHGVGIACHFTFGGYAAHAFEVSVEGKDLLIHRAVCAVDVGRPINPLGVQAQMIGGTIDGISTALNLAITVKNGQVQQHNFPDYPLLRMAQAPQEVEVHIVESSEEPSGAGEIGIPSVAPALANAIYAATTVRVRKLPIMPELLRLL